jgi:hypothetical protein
MQATSATWCVYVGSTKRETGALVHVCVCPYDEQEVSYITVTERYKANKAPEKCIGVLLGVFISSSI